MAELTDLQLIDKYCEECREFVHPFLFRDIMNRGLYNIINMLPKDVNEAKAIARARMKVAGKYVGDEEIEQIADQINRLNYLVKSLSTMNMADVDKTLPVLKEMIERSEFVKDYYK